MPGEGVGGAVGRYRSLAFELLALFKSEQSDRRDAYISFAMVQKHFILVSELQLLFWK